MESIRKIISPLLILALIVMPVSELISFDNSEPEQAKDKPVVIHEKVGESIDLKERDYYKLFLIYENFQSAAVLLTDDGSFVLQIKELKKGRQYTVRFPLERSSYYKLKDYIDRFEGFTPDSLDSYFTTQEKAILGLALEAVKIEESKSLADQRKVQEGLALVRSKGNAVTDSQKVQDGLVLVRTNGKGYSVTDEDTVKRPVIVSEKRRWKFQISTEEDNKRAGKMVREKWEKVKVLSKEKWSKERWKEERKNDWGTNNRAAGALLGFTLGAAAGMLIGEAIQGEEIREEHHYIPARGVWEEGWDGPYYREISPAKRWTDYFYSYKHKYAPHLGAGIGGVAGAVAGYYLGKKADKKYYILVPGSIRKEEVAEPSLGSAVLGCLVVGPALGALIGMTMVINQNGREAHRRTFNWELGITGFIAGSFLGAKMAEGFNNRRKHKRLWKESLLEEHTQTYLKFELLPTDPSAFSMRTQKLPCGSVFSEYRMNMMRLSF